MNLAWSVRLVASAYEFICMCGFAVALSLRFGLDAPWTILVASTVGFIFAHMIGITWVRGIESHEALQRAINEREKGQQ